MIRKKTKFNIIFLKNHMQGFIVIGDKNIVIKDWTRTWKKDTSNGILCDDIVLKRAFWYHLYICGTGRKSYQFLLDDNMVGDNLLYTNPKIKTFRKICSIRL